MFKIVDAEGREVRVSPGQFADLKRNAKAQRRFTNRRMRNHFWQSEWLPAP
jgi:hypothetical protein